eukprot:4153966-Pyramimonas_sp.AAC.1
MSRLEGCPTNCSRTNHSEARCGCDESSDLRGHRGSFIGFTRRHHRPGNGQQVAPPYLSGVKVSIAKPTELYYLDDQDLARTSLDILLLL